MHKTELMGDDVERWKELGRESEKGWKTREERSVHMESEGKVENYARMNEEKEENGGMK